MADVFLLHEDYEVRELRDGIATLRNVQTGNEIERRVLVNVNTGALRIDAKCSRPSETDLSAAR
jgi:hypothetical protein